MLESKESVDRKRIKFLRWCNSANEQLKGRIKKYTTLLCLIRHKKCIHVRYHSFIFNNIYYWAEIYWRTSKTIIQPLEKVKHSSLRLLQFQDRYYPTNELHKEYTILKVTLTIEYDIKKLTHFILYSPNLIPAPCIVLFDLNTYSTNTKQALTITGKYQLKCQPSDHWNKVPQEICQQPTHSQFKTAFYEWNLLRYHSSTLTFASLFMVSTQIWDYCACLSAPLFSVSHASKKLSLLFVRDVLSSKYLHFLVTV